MDIEHDAKEHVVSIYLQGWVDKILEKYSMTKCKTSDLPYKYRKPVFAGKQKPTQEDDSERLSKEQRKRRAVRALLLSCSVYYTTSKPQF